VCIVMLYVGLISLTRITQFNSPYLLNTLEDLFWDCNTKFPITIYNASNLLIISYVMSSLSLFEATCVSTLHFDKLRDVVLFKGKQYSNFMQSSWGTCRNMSVNCVCCNFIGLATVSNLVLSGINCRSFEYWVDCKDNCCCTNTIHHNFWPF
jgi:hypothetical protein